MKFIKESSIEVFDRMIEKVIQSKNIEPKRKRAFLKMYLETTMKNGWCPLSSSSKFKSNELIHEIVNEIKYDKA